VIYTPTITLWVTPPFALFCLRPPRSSNQEGLGSLGSISSTLGIQPRPLATRAQSYRHPFLDKHLLVLQSSTQLFNKHLPAMGTANRKTMWGKPVLPQPHRTEQAPKHTSKKASKHMLEILLAPYSSVCDTHVDTIIGTILLLGCFPPSRRSQRLVGPF
jgi:hypothetical protein